MRLTLLRTDDRHWRCIWSFHHLVLDGWSIALVLREVHTAYAALAEGSEPELPPARPYKDFISWLGTRDEESDREFWTRELDGLDRPFRAPLPERPFPEALQEGDAHGEHRVTLPPAAVDELSESARARGLTLNALAQGAFALLLHRYGGQEQHHAGGQRHLAARGPDDLADLGAGLLQEVEGIGGHGRLRTEPARHTAHATRTQGRWLHGCVSGIAGHPPLKGKLPAASQGPPR